MARIVLSHVTNSSSSSFVIALKNNVNEENLISLIVKAIKNCTDGEFDNLFEEYVENTGIYVPDNSTDEDKFNIAAERILNDISSSVNYGLELGDYKVYSETYGTECSRDLINWFFYYGIYPETEDLKVKSFS